MPKVAGKKYPYTAAGKKAAAKAKKKKQMPNHTGLAAKLKARRDATNKAQTK
tara:strand:- start:51 stop:206 length:156 start_codon:yes stop_codon:yes gene_type:complete